MKSRAADSLGQVAGAGDERRIPDRVPDSLTGPIEVRSERDTLRETFDTFAEGLCVVGASGALEVSNAAGGRLYATPLRAELAAAARQTIDGGAALDRSLTLDGRTYA